MIPEIYEKLKSQLINHEFYYPPSLGMAQLLADIEWKGEVASKKVELNSKISTKSSFPKYSVDIFPQEGLRYIIEKSAQMLDAERQGYNFQELVTEITGKGLKGNYIKENEISYVYPSSSSILFSISICR